MRRLLHVIRKEFLELRQDPRLFGIVIIAPIVQLTMLGYAATTDVRNVPVLVVDEDASSERSEEHTSELQSHRDLHSRPTRRSSDLVIIAPIVQLTMLGYAATTDVRNVPVLVVDEDASSE